MINNKQAPFIVWKPYQRRVDAFKERLNVCPIYIHFVWEERNKLGKALSYFLKLVNTFCVLFRNRPALFYVQAPPTFLVYAAFIYSKFSQSKYIVDAHDLMVHGSFWCKMPFAKYVLENSAAVIVHNTYVAERAREWGIQYTILMDRPPDIGAKQYPIPQTTLRKSRRPRVMVPCSFYSDEPLDELKKATIMLPDIDFFFTWYNQGLSVEFLHGFRNNSIFTGFLPLPEFNVLLADADVILVLTTRDGTQPSGASEALAFQKPLVVSDFQTIRELFPVGSIYVQNHARAIAQGIRTALQNMGQLASEMASFKKDKLLTWENQFKALRAEVPEATSPDRVGMRTTAQA